jgi:hypothetical protein
MWERCIMSDTVVLVVGHFSAGREYGNTIIIQCRLSDSDLGVYRRLSD